MKLTIAGVDRSHDVIPALTQEAERMAALPYLERPPVIPAPIAATSLSAATSEADYLQRFNKLIGWRAAVHPNVLALPQAPGWHHAFKARLRRLLWRLLQYQRERIAFRQNLINSQLTSGLIFESEQRTHEVAELRATLARLQQEINALRQQPAAGQPGEKQ